MNGFGKGRRREVPGAALVEKLVPGAAPGGGVLLAGTGAGADEEQGLSKAALKNKKKREAAKKAKAEASASGSGAEGDREGRISPRAPNGPRSKSRTAPNGRGRSNSRSRGDGLSKDVPTGPPRKQERLHDKLEGELEKLDNVHSGQDDSAGQDDKKVRGLLKKFRAIQDLKQRYEKGETLEDTQVKKIKTEESVKKELLALGVDMFDKV